LQARLFQIGTNIDNIETVTTDHGGSIPAQYEDFIEVVSNVKAETFPLHRPTDHMINLEPSYKLPYVQIYNLSEFELKILKAYIELKTVKACIEINLEKGFSQHSSSPAAALILFGKMKDGGLQLCVDYQALNLGMVKHRYPVLQI
jgi:hypothetical protein